MADDRKFDEWSYAKADGDPDWLAASETFGHVWERAYDLLRFHRGAGFRITDRASGDTGPVRHLSDIDDYLKSQMLQHPDTVFAVQSEKDRFSLVFRRRVVESPLLGDDLVRFGELFVGAPYVLGGTGTSGIDCSGVTLREAEKYGIDLPHKASQQWAMFGTVAGFLRINRKDIQIGDFLVHWGGDHISTYVGKVKGYDAVLDAQPHGTEGPSGWGPILSGCRIRPMATGWYTDWEHVNSVCRLVRINGRP